MSGQQGDQDDPDWIVEVQATVSADHRGPIPLSAFVPAIAAAICCPALSRLPPGFLPFCCNMEFRAFAVWTWGANLVTYTEAEMNRVERACSRFVNTLNTYDSVA